jgi:glycosyltransferase involved in cell wall biosynthesis
MRIAQVVATFPPYHGGMGYVCYHNALELARRGHDVTVFTLEHGQLSYDTDPSSFRIVRLRTPLLYGDGGTVPQLFSSLKGFDIIHLHYPFYGGAEYVYLASLLRGQPYFLTYHMDVYGNTPLKKLIIGLYEPVFMRRVIEKAGRIGALSLEHLRSSKVAGYVDWTKVVEMPNGVDVEKYHPGEKDKELVKKYGLEGKVVVLFVGNLQPFKGLHLLIEAVAGIDDPRVCLLVVGGGYAEKEYRALVRQLGVDNKVIFAGQQQPDGALPDYYRLGDFLVLPSTHSESFGLVVLEAMASGKPAIVSDLPGPSGLIDEGRDGLVVRVGDTADLRKKIEYLACRGEEREHMGAAGREKVVGKYSWEKIGERLELTFDEMMRSRS